MSSSGHAPATSGSFPISSRSLSDIGIIWSIPNPNGPEDFFLAASPFTRWTLSVRSDSSVSKSFVTWRWRPSPSETMRTSDATPITTPAAVSTVRPFRRARLPQAMATVSPAVIAQHLSVAKLDRPPGEAVGQTAVMGDEKDRLAGERLEDVEDL